MSLHRPNKNKNNLWAPLPSFPVFGGQIISHALYELMENYPKFTIPHSLNIYFLKPGLVNSKIDYNIEIVKEGKLITLFNIIGIQNNKKIFTMSVSFTNSIEGSKEFQCDEIFKLEKDYENLNSFINNEDYAVNKNLSILTDKIEIQVGKAEKDNRCIKFTKRENCIDGKDYAAYISFISDFFLIESALIPLKIKMFDPALKLITSMDHKIFFHDLSIENELILRCKCIKIGQSRALCIGYIFTLNGKLIATVIQEGIVKYSSS